jgi:hypothetical protein
MTDPDVNLSIHPARATLKKATAFHQDKEFLRFPVDSILMRVTCSHDASCRCASLERPGH